MYGLFHHITKEQVNDDFKGTELTRIYLGWIPGTSTILFCSVLFIN